MLRTISSHAGRFLCSEAETEEDVEVKAFTCMKLSVSAAKLTHKSNSLPSLLSVRIFLSLAHRDVSVACIQV